MTLEDQLKCIRHLLAQRLHSPLVPSRPGETRALTAVVATLEKLRVERVKQEIGVSDEVPTTTPALAEIEERETK